MKKPKLQIFREIQDDKQTSGIFTIKQDNFTLFSAVVLERGWLNNLIGKSCLPMGTYNLVYEYSPAFKRNLWELKGTEPRTECKFHQAKFWNQLKGCISPGVYYKKINTDEYLDLAYSSFMLERMHQVLKPFQGQVLQLEITGLDWLN